MQGESDENITEQTTQENDSINISDSEKEKIRPELQNYYDGYIRDYGDEVKASIVARYDIRQIIDETGFVKLFQYDPRNDLISGISITESVKKATDYLYFKPVSDEKTLFAIDGKSGDSNERYVDVDIFENGLYRKFYEDLLNLEEKFSIAEATKSIEDITILQAYAFEAPRQNRMGDYEGTRFIYIVTNKGDFVFYSYLHPYSNPYLLPADLFVSLSEKIFERERFYRTAEYIEDEDKLEGFVDLMPYSVGKENKDINQRLRNNLENLHDKYPFFKGDPDFMGYASQYYFAKGIGLDAAWRLRRLLTQMDPGYDYAFTNGRSRKEGDLSWSDFLQTLADAGCTTYDECRAYIDAAIEERKNPPPVTNTPSGGGDTTQNTPDEGGKYNFLFWLIPSVLVLLAAAVAIFILKKKKKA
ncbi:MAG: hypothetical protein E7607_00300 [Ruminococcaceae bacterium]|nr:hypothetical protein [Oscillospiraceae bacterium]